MRLDRFDWIQSTCQLWSKPKDPHLKWREWGKNKKRGRAEKGREGDKRRNETKSEVKDPPPLPLQNSLFPTLMSNVFQGRREVKIEKYWTYYKRAATADFRKRSLPPRSLPGPQGPFSTWPSCTRYGLVQIRWSRSIYVHHVPYIATEA